MQRLPSFVGADQGRGGTSVYPSLHAVSLALQSEAGVATLAPASFEHRVPTQGNLTQLDRNTPGRLQSNSTC